jgi:hypothetical protein
MMIDDFLSGRIRAGFKKMGYLHYAELVTLAVAPGAIAYTFYWVPFRHSKYVRFNTDMSAHVLMCILLYDVYRWPYTDAQMKWRNAIRANIKNPASRRTYLVAVFAAYMFDKVKNSWKFK